MQRIPRNTSSTTRWNRLALQHTNPRFHLPHNNSTMSRQGTFFFLLTLLIDPRSIVHALDTRQRVSPIDTDHNCYFTNRIYQHELKAEEDHPLLKLLQVQSTTTTTLHDIGSGCEAQKVQSECVQFSSLEFKNTRQPLDQCGWCTKGVKSLCATCSVVRDRELDGYICAPDTNACHHPSAAESRGADDKPKVEEPPPEPPKPDDTPACATVTDGEPCKVSDSSGSTPFSRLRKKTIREKEKDPTLPDPGPTPEVNIMDKSKPDDPVTPEERAGSGPEHNDFDEPVRYGSAIIPWTAWQFCERLIQHAAEPEVSDAMSKSESPPNEFTSICLGMFGNVCLPQCRTLANLYDEASRPGAGEVGGLDGNNNVWDRTNDVQDLGRWDNSRNIPTAGEFSGPEKDFGPTFAKEKRGLIYQITQSDCVKCVKHDDCTPDCLIDGDCSGELVEDVPIDDEAMNGKMEDALL